MNETLKEMIQRLGARAPEMLRQVRRLRNRLVEQHHLAAQVFLGEDGNPTPAAAEWLRRLARDSYVESTTFSGDRDAMLIREGQRKLALQILSSVRLDTERLASLRELEREVQ